MSAVLGRGAALAAIVGVFEYTGGKLMPAGKDPEMSDAERKEMLKNRYRRPYQETINELGEGRGISFSDLQLGREILSEIIDTVLQVSMAQATKSGDGNGSKKHTESM